MWWALTADIDPGSASPCTHIWLHGCHVESPSCGHTCRPPHRPLSSAPGSDFSELVSISLWRDGGDYKPSVWHCHICLSHLSNTDIIILSSLKVLFLCSPVTRCFSSQEHILCFFCQLTAWPPLPVCVTAGAAVGARPPSVCTKRQEQKWNHHRLGLQRHHGHHQTPHADSICRREPGFSEL